MQFIWSFPQFIVNPRDGTLDQVVVGINWVCVGSNGDVSSSKSGTVNLGSPNPAEFIPYDQITESQAYLWVSQSINMQAIQDSLGIELAAISKPVIQPQNPPYVGS